MKYIHLLVITVLLSAILFSCGKEEVIKLDVTQTEISFSKEGGCQSVTLTTNKDWTASSSASWLKVTSSGSSGVALLQVTAEANPKFEDRSATVVTKVGTMSKTINIIQSGDGQLYIPDSNFREYCLANFDWNKDGILSYKEASSVTHMYCSEKEISSLEGIEHFTALTLLGCEYNHLTALDVSKNTALEILNCGVNHLTALDISKNTALEELYCAANQLTALDVSKNTALTTLECSANHLTALDISNNTALEWLYCDGNQLTALDVSKNTGLEDLSCNGNSLTALDVSKNTALETLDCSDNQLTALEVSKNTALENLSCNGNSLTVLDVSKNTALEKLYCYANLLTTLDVSNNTALKTLWCNNNPDLKEVWLKSGQSIDEFYKDNHTEIKYKP